MTHLTHWLKRVLCFSVLLAGCRKATEEEFKSYLRMTIDGVAVECDRAIEASGNHTRGTSLTTQLLSISGNWTKSGQETVSVQLEQYDFPNTRGEWQLNSPGGATIWLEFLKGSLVTGETYYARSNDTKLTIEQVDDRYIKGTFSFVDYMNTGPGTSVKKTVTKGAFHIKRNS